MAWSRSATADAQLGALLARVPAAFFAMVLGVAGLANDWRAASPLWSLPSGTGDALMGVAIAIWIVMTLLYAAKWVWARDAALAEWRHPVQCCYVGLVPTATMTVALGLVPHADTAGRALFVAGAVGQGAFAVWRTGGLWTGASDAQSVTPVLYLPSVAGGFVLATGAGTLGHATIGELAFGAGLLSWLILESVVLYRLLAQAPLPTSLLPTLGIQAAPPVVGCVAYLSLTTGAPDRLALALLGYGLLQAMVLARLAPRFVAGPFAPSYWAFTFGVTALAQAPLRMVARGADELGWLAAALFMGANVVVGLIALGTLTLAARGRLLPLPLPTPVHGAALSAGRAPVGARNTSDRRRSGSLHASAAPESPRLTGPRATSLGSREVGTLPPRGAPTPYTNGAPP